MLGALTGVGIWFTIALVQPQATSALVTTFVWAWAIEWAFFATEIAAAMVYYYGWDRLSPQTHLAVGWVYFASAWASLAVIAGILAFMLTSGDWVRTRSFVDGYFNPTYLPMVALRTSVAVGLAGLYVLFAASFLKDATLKARVARWSATRWIVPAAVLVPLTLLWYLSVRGRRRCRGSRDARARSRPRPPPLLGRRLFGTVNVGQPIVRGAARVAVLGTALLVLASLALVALRARRYTRLEAGLLVVLGIVSMGASEWVREGLRKPWVIDRYMFVNGVRAPARRGSRARRIAGRRPVRARRPRSTWRPRHLALGGGARRLAAGRPGFRGPPRGREGRARGRGRPRGVQARVLGLPHRARAPRGPSARPGKGRRRDHRCPGRGGEAGHRGRAARLLVRPGVRVATWLGRRMPPFAGTGAEKRALAVHLARLGGDERAGLEATAAAGAGADAFEQHCSACHGPESPWPVADRLRGRSAADFYEMIGRLPQVREEMPPFSGTEDERRALAQYLGGLAATAPGDARPATDAPETEERR